MRNKTKGLPVIYRTEITSFFTSSISSAHIHHPISRSSILSFVYSSQLETKRKRCSGKISNSNNLFSHSRHPLSPHPSPLLSLPRSLFTIRKKIKNKIKWCSKISRSKAAPSLPRVPPASSVIPALLTLAATGINIELPR